MHPALRHFEQGLVHAEKGEYDLAIWEFNLAELRWPVWPPPVEPCVNRGLVYALKGEYDKALGEYDKALHLASLAQLDDEKIASIYFNKGDAYRLKGVPSKAIANYNKAIKLNPKYASAYYTRGLVYKELGEEVKAAEDLEKAISLGEESEEWELVSSARREVEEMWEEKRTGEATERRREKAKEKVAREEMERLIEEEEQRLEQKIEEEEEGGCFIATAVYSTPFAPEIGILRKFRDEVLLEDGLGREFVRLYYRISPPMANFISEHPIAKAIIREIAIKPIVKIVKAALLRGQ